MTLSGTICLITGANTGLGLAVSKNIAGMGANTILLCRSKAKGEYALSEIKNEHPNASVESMVCDLSSLKSIQYFIIDLKTRYSKLDIFYNNAAVMKQKRTVTEDGFEMMFQVNYLAPFILMNSLRGMLKNSQSPFIINNGRPPAKLRLDIDDLHSIKNYSMYHSFFRTKLCLLFASLEMSRRTDNSGITVMMIDPGTFKSNLIREIPFMNWMKNLFSSAVDKAAENILHHIASDDIKNKNGKVFKKKQEIPLTEYWQDTGISERLWAITESLLKNTEGYM